MPGRAQAGHARRRCGWEHYGRITAGNLRRAHAALDSHRTRGKLVLEGF
ncbi:hypothetical protein [Xanthomonas citri]|nr:hypothetical protein [Xanthomonas citri]MEE5091198.1 hypothetical protein [Xanthomonas euvesicatoria]